MRVKVGDRTIEVPPARLVAVEPLTNIDGTLYFWRAVETSDARWQPQWGTCPKHETTTTWRDAGKPRIDQHDAEESGRKYAEYIAAKK